MSPRATLPVEDDGGMSTADIHLLVEKTSHDTDEKWATRMDDYSGKIEQKLDDHAKSVEKKLEKRDSVIDLRLNAQDTALKTILEEVRSSRSQQNDWHEGDLEYRAGVQEWRTTQEPKIEKLVNDAKITAATAITTNLKIDDINTKLTFVQWFVALCKGVGWTAEKSVIIAEGGKKLWAAGAFFLTLLLFIFSFFRPDSGMLVFIKMWLRSHGL